MEAKDAKALAAIKLFKASQPVRRRRKKKRELVDLALPSVDLDELDHLKATMSVATQGWAKLGPGSVKLVKRITPTL